MTEMSSKPLKSPAKKFAPVDTSSTTFYSSGRANIVVNSPTPSSNNDVGTAYHYGSRVPLASPPSPPSAALSDPQPSQQQLDTNDAKQAEELELEYQVQVAADDADFIQHQHDALSNLQMLDPEEYVEEQEEDDGGSMQSELSASPTSVLVVTASPEHQVISEQLLDEAALLEYDESELTAAAITEHAQSRRPSQVEVDNGSNGIDFASTAIIDTDGDPDELHSLEVAEADIVSSESESDEDVEALIESTSEPPGRSFIRPRDVTVAEANIESLLESSITDTGLIVNGQAVTRPVAVAPVPTTPVTPLLLLPLYFLTLYLTYGLWRIRHSPELVCLMVYTAVQIVHQLVGAVEYLTFNPARAGSRLPDLLYASTTCIDGIINTLSFIIPLAYARRWHIDASLFLIRPQVIGAATAAVMVYSVAMLIQFRRVQRTTVVEEAVTASHGDVRSQLLLSSTTNKQQRQFAAQQLYNTAHTSELLLAIVSTMLGVLLWTHYEFNVLLAGSAALLLSRVLFESRTSTSIGRLLFIFCHLLTEHQLLQTRVPAVYA